MCIPVRIYIIERSFNDWIWIQIAPLHQELINKELAENNFKSVIISSGGEMAEKYKYKGVDHHKIEIESKGFLNFFSSSEKCEIK